MSSLHSSTSLGALVLALIATPALADTTVSTATTTPLATSTAGNVTVTSDGSIAVPSGTAITVDSNNSVDNEGGVKLVSTGANGATGIAVNAGTTSTIKVGSNATIAVSENFTPDDTDENGNPTGTANGSVAQASNRYGIHVLPGAATSGSIDNEGKISVEGLNSGGIVVDSDYNGSILNGGTSTTGGTISVLGDNSVGISTKNVNGNVTVNGTTTVTGAGARGLVVNGDVSGAVTIQGTIAQSVSFVTDNGTTLSLSRDALAKNAAAVEIDGNVAGGIYLAAPPVDTDTANTDEDGDGVKDTDEGTAAVSSYGNGPAVQVGGATNISVGGVKSNSGTYSVAIDGSATSNAYYSKTDAFGLVIGGQGGNVTLTNGIGVTGTLKATTYDSNATALLISAGSTVTSLYNSGTIAAALTSGGTGSTTGIRDMSGTLTSIENTGSIGATGTATDNVTAIDLSANTSGVAITQHINAADQATSDAYVKANNTPDPTIYTSIAGKILLGSGNDTLTASSGTITGGTYFGAGDDTLALSGNTVYTGNVYFGAGTGTATLAGASKFYGSTDFAGNAGTLTLSDTAIYGGAFANAANLAVTVNSGATLTGRKAETIEFGNLTVKSGGNIGVYINGADDTHSLISVNNATIENGAHVTATIANLVGAEGTYQVLTANSLDVQGTLDSSASLPFIFNGAVTKDANSVYLTISLKDASELGINRATSSVWNAAFAAAHNDAPLAQSLLEIGDSPTLQAQLTGLLPDHAGGVFDAVTHADRMAARHVTDDTSIFHDYNVNGWFEPLYYRTSRDADDTSEGYKANGWGLSGGYERRTGIGFVGLSYAWMSSNINDGAGVDKLKVTQHDFGLFWRTLDGPFLAWARLGAAPVSISSTRTFTGSITDTPFSYTTAAKWKGWMLSGNVGASYRYDVSSNFHLKPKVEIEQFWLKENGYNDTPTLDAIGLTVSSRTSKTTTVTPSLTAAYSFGPITSDGYPLTLQGEVGRRQVVSGRPGDTTAYFDGGSTYAAGDPFTIASSKLQNAWIGEASILSGGYDFTWKLTGRAEKTPSAVDISARASISMAF